MPWFKVDDGFAVHPKVLTAGNQAVGLWCRAGAWCAQQLTDGFVPASTVAVLGGRPRDARALVAAGLWQELDGGYQFHGWHDYQPTREQVREERRQAAERQKRARNRARESRRDAGVSHGEVQQESRSPASRSPRPDPTRPVVTEVTTRPGGPDNDNPTEPAQPPKARKRATTRPEGWKPNERHLALARQLDVDPSRELAQFTDHHDAKGSKFIDWDAAFRTWLRNARAPARPPAAPTSSLPDVATLDAEDPPEDPADFAAWARARQGRA